MTSHDLPSLDHLLKVLRGRNGGLRPSKPRKENGAVCFVWRLARFNSGHDPHMPVMAYFDLADWARSHRPEAEVSGIINDAGRRLCDECEALADAVIEAMGLDKFGAARAWRGLI